MTAARNIENTGKYFEIFSESQIAALKEEKDDHIKYLTNHLVKIVNNGMHAKGGWYDKIYNEVETTTLIEDKQVKSQIQDGAKRYIEAANKLQKPKNGNAQIKYLPRSKKHLEFKVNVYEQFLIL